MAKQKKHRISPVFYADQACLSVAAAYKDPFAVSECHLVMKIGIEVVRFKGAGIAPGAEGQQKDDGIVGGAFFF